MRIFAAGVHRQPSACSRGWASPSAPADMVPRPSSAPSEGCIGKTECPRVHCPQAVPTSATPIPARLRQDDPPTGPA